MLLYLLSITLITPWHKLISMGHLKWPCQNNPEAKPFESGTVTTGLHDEVSMSHNTPSPRQRRDAAGIRA